MSHQPVKCQLFEVPFIILQFKLGIVFSQIFQIIDVVPGMLAMMVVFVLLFHCPIWVEVGDESVELFFLCIGVMEVILLSNFFDVSLLLLRANAAVFQRNASDASRLVGLDFIIFDILIKFGTFSEYGHIRLTVGSGE